MTDEIDATKDVATDAVEDAIEQASEERAAEAAAAARADEKQAALETRLAALETRGGNAPSFDPSSIGDVITGALAPLVERLERLETAGPKAAEPASEPTPEPTPEPEEKPDPFASQIDLEQIARSVPDTMPKINHFLFRKIGR